MTKEKKVTVGPKTVKEIKTLAAALEAHKAGPEAVNPCATWALVKPVWPLIVRLVTLIPRVGGQISAALQAIGAVLDQLCPAP